MVENLSDWDRDPREAEKVETPIEIRANHGILAVQDSEGLSKEVRR
jgi:hypothetical protein